MTGLIPQPFIDDLLSRTDIVELIDSYVPLKKRGNSHLACCPFHNEKTPSFNVVAKKQFYHCFGCGASGNAISFAMNYLHLSFVDAIENLAERLGLQVPRSGHKDTVKKNITYYQLLERVSLLYQKTLKHAGAEAITYLKNRQVSGEIARTYHLGYAPPGWQFLENELKTYKQELIATGMLVPKENGSAYDRYRNRVMYPIHDRHGRIIGFGGRSIHPNDKPKYLNSPETIIFQKNRELYGLYQAIQQENPIDFILVVEGYMDVIALAQFGITNCVATLGTATSTYHIQLLSKHTKKLIFCFDGDKAGRSAAWRALESSLPYLNSGIEINFIFLPEGQDPDSMIREEGKEKFLARLNTALPLHQYLLSTLMQGFDITTISGKTQLINTAKPFLQKIPEGSYKQLLLDELTRYTRMDHHRLNQLLSDKKLDKLSDSGVNITRSPIRVAIALLLQHPEIVSDSKNKLYPDFLKQNNHPILHQLLQQISENPGINTAKLVESWRDSPLFEAITKLAFWDHQVPEDALVKEFIDTLFFLEKQQRDEQIQQLLTKARLQGLNDTERIELQDMLKKRHSNTEVK
ncbi:DNA primase (plasmid) [Legionella adelaidensis]|uniref:DNA primase n=1 Tax=Legionella adelaidensis TaxID=45056 RepID=A0A0W0R2R9_9GAMM|nr:DNA primase [Legionella adelaidensis]KTC65361.1 DNA primase [Legionella adelaidensis]VEH84817.1 DNA primase [Legionella adelaidensis]